jgi:DNA-binding CsgD family transcriptional regulator
VYADALMRKGEWLAAEDLATETLGAHANADLHLMRVLGLLRMRTGRSGAEEHLEGAWGLSQRITEIAYFLQVGACLAERMWLSGRIDAQLIEQLRSLVLRGFQQEFPWPAGWLAFWLWRLGEISEVPAGTPEPHAQAMRGEVAEAAELWKERQMPYRRAMALSCGDTNQRLEALEILNYLGADAVAAKVRKDLRDDGVPVPRGKGRATREHAAGLTARQAEVLLLLAEGLSNPEVADRLFLSPRTVENHVSAVLAKLDTSTRDEAVVVARSQGMI